MLHIEHQNVKSGYLEAKLPMKGGNKWKSWKRRWVIGHQLMRSQSQLPLVTLDLYDEVPLPAETVIERRTVYLEGSTFIKIRRCWSRTRSYAFAVDQHQDMPLIFLSGESETDSQSWMAFLQSAFFSCEGQGICHPYTWNVRPEIGNSYHVSLIHHLSSLSLSSCKSVDLLVVLQSVVLLLRSGIIFMEWPWEMIQQVTLAPQSHPQDTNKIINLEIKGSGPCCLFSHQALAIRDKIISNIMRIPNDAEQNTNGKDSAAFRPSTPIVEAKSRSMDALATQSVAKSMAELPHKRCSSFSLENLQRLARLPRRSESMPKVIPVSRGAEGGRPASDSSRDSGVIEEAVQLRKVGTESKRYYDFGEFVINPPQSKVAEQGSDRDSRCSESDKILQDIVTNEIEEDQQDPTYEDLDRFRKNIHHLLGIPHNGLPFQHVDATPPPLPPRHPVKIERRRKDLRRYLGIAKDDNPTYDMPPPTIRTYVRQPMLLRPIPAIPLEQKKGKAKKKKQQLKSKMGSWISGGQKCVSVPCPSPRLSLIPNALSVLDGRKEGNSYRSFEMENWDELQLESVRDVQERSSNAGILQEKTVPTDKVLKAQVDISDRVPPQLYSVPDPNIKAVVPLKAPLQTEEEVVEGSKKSTHQPHYVNVAELKSFETTKTKKEMLLMTTSEEDTEAAKTSPSREVDREQLSLFIDKIFEKTFRELEEVMLGSLVKTDTQ